MWWWISPAIPRLQGTHSMHEKGVVDEESHVTLVEEQIIIEAQVPMSSSTAPLVMTRETRKPSTLDPIKNER